MLKPLFTKKNPEMTIKKKKCMRVISVILSLLLISLLLYAFISVIVPEVSRSIIAISYQFPYYIRNLTQFSNKLLQDNPTLNDLFIQFVDDYSGEFSNFLNKNHYSPDTGNPETYFPESTKLFKDAVECGYWCNHICLCTV